MVATLPTTRQLHWQELEFGMFCHFGVNTFTNKEWGDGNEDPQCFHPTHLDCRQWARVARQAGMRYAILTAKHHDGFCLWPTATTEHCVRNSPWRQGQGDVVREFVDACRAEGILPGVYCSPWDRNASCYPDPQAYSAFYTAQLRELCSNYGPLAEIWFDGAGSEGYTYDWEAIMSTVRQLQPEAIIFNMGDPDIRWGGNETGFAPSHLSNLVEGTLPDGTNAQIYRPVEVDTTLCQSHQQLWFWHPDSAQHLRSLDELLGVYYRSIGHGANLLLNVAPSAAGVLEKTEVDHLLAFTTEIQRRFGTPLATVEQGEQVLEMTLEHPTLVTRYLAMENLRRGEHIQEWVLEAESEDSGKPYWNSLVSGTTLGHKRLGDIAPIVAQRFRLRVIRSSGPARLRRLQLFGRYRRNNEQSSASER